MHQKGDLTCLSKSRQLASGTRSNQKGSSTLIFQEAFQAHLGQDPPSTMASGAGIVPLWVNKGVLNALSMHCSLFPPPSSPPCTSERGAGLRFPRSRHWEDSGTNGLSGR